MHPDEEKLFLPGKPAFYAIETDANGFANLNLQLGMRHPGAVIRRLRGPKSSSILPFFDEWAAVLQFPYYFGENWGAFEECINDLDWVAGSAYILMIDNAECLLAESDDDFGVLVRLLSDANANWVTPNKDFPRGREPTPFHVLYRCDASAAEAFARRLAAAGVEPEVLAIPIVMG